MVSFSGESNSATTAGWSVTVSGLGFGPFDGTPTSGLGSSSCMTSAWASSTSAMCLSAAGEGAGHDSVVTVVGYPNALTTSFSYDGSF